MKVDISRTYEFRLFEPGELLNAFRTTLGNLGIELSKASFSVKSSLGEDGTENRELLNSEVGTICEIGKKPEYLTLSFEIGVAQFCFIFISEERGLLGIYVSTPDPELSSTIISDLEKELVLKRVKPEKIDIEEKIDNLVSRVSEIEQRFLRRDKGLICFLSHRFDPKTKALALELTRFLNLIGVEVITGAIYEPRKVSEKVLSLLGRPLDFVVYLITKEGESTWTRDEITVSLAKGYSVIPLVEEGANLKKGILGDLERIPFASNHIGDTFISLIDAVNFIKREKEIKELAKNQNRSNKKGEGK